MQRGLLLKRHYEAAGSQFRSRQHRERSDHAERVDRGFEREHGVAEMRTTAGIDIAHTSRLEPHVPERDAIVKYAGVVMQQGMVAQILRLPQGVFAAYQLWAADRCDGQREQLVDAARVIAMPEDREIGPNQFPMVVRSAALACPPW